MMEAKIGRFNIDNIYCEDCYKAIKDIPDKSIDCVYVDIPYLMADHGGARTSKLGIRMTKKSDELSDIDKGIDLEILNEFVRVMKKINIFVWCSKLQILPIMNFFDNLHCKYEMLVWCKSNPSPTCNNVWLPDVEYCLYFRESGVKLNDGYELKSKWYKSAINKKDKAKFSHPTIKPLELVKRHLLHTTQPNDIILDSFLGSGTTAVACSEIGRHYLGFEKNEKWFDIARNRLDKVEADGQISMFLN